MGEDVRNVIIIGSGPAGYTAGLYTARAMLNPLMFAGYMSGGQLMLTSDIENFPGYPQGIGGPEMMMDLRAQAERFGLEVQDRNVGSVDFSSRPFMVETEGEKFFANAVIICTGAEAIWLGAEGEDEQKGRGISTCATCDGYFFREKPIIVVGGGDSAVEEATFLTKFASHVTVVHRREELRASKIMQDKAFENPKISFEWNSELAEVRDVEKGVVTSAVLRDINTGAIKELPVEGVFIAIGHTPNTSLFTGLLDLDENGYVVAGSGTRTSVPGVFACGDVQDHVYRQAITAAGTGCMAAIDAERYLESQG